MSRYSHEENRNHAANLIERSKQTEHLALGVSKIVLPGVKCLDTVEQHTVVGENSLG